MVKKLAKEVGKEVLKSKVESLSEEHKDTNLSANLVHNGFGLFESYASRTLYIWFFIIGAITNFFVCGILFKIIFDSYIMGGIGSLTSIYVDYRVIKYYTKKTYKTVKQEVSTTSKLVKDKFKKGDS